MIFRPGSIGALMDEYERAARDMKAVLSNVTEAEYHAVVDPNPNLDSIRTMMTHVINSGYGYATYVSKALGTPIDRPKVETVSYAEVIPLIDSILKFTDDVLKPHYLMPEDDMDTITMTSPWKVVYSIDQMLEHAVCHVLRHRRQVEKYVGRMRE